MHDARVFRLSQLFDAAENDLILVEPTVDVNGTIVRPLIVGDSAYPLNHGCFVLLKIMAHLIGSKRSLMKSYRKLELSLNMHTA